MTMVLRDTTIISNALYAKKTNQLSYDEVKRYKILLYRMLVEKYKYILFDMNADNFIEENGKFFVKAHDGVSALSKIDDEYINKINSCYPVEAQDIIRESHEKFRDKPKSLSKVR